MADKDYKAFIVEGEAREPQVIDNISKVFFKYGNLKIITLPAGENIYMLWKKLKADDFDTDIIEVLRESNKKIREQLEGLSRDDFSEVFLFFDYDVHQTNLGKADDGDVINQMLESFDNETENGKLYISYPMVEALRDFEADKCGNGDNCFVEISDLAEYKNISSRNSLNPHFRDYNIDVWKEIVNVFSMRISCLLGNAQHRSSLRSHSHISCLSWDHISSHSLPEISTTSTLSTCYQQESLHLSETVQERRTFWLHGCTS